MKTVIEKALINLYEHSKIHPLYKDAIFRQERIVISRGNLEEPDYLFVGEAPGFQEAKKGEPFVGISGEILSAWQRHTGIKNYCVINAMTLLPLDKTSVKQRKDRIRKPTMTDINFFKPYVIALIKAIQPKRIILMGKKAVELFNIPWHPGKWQGNIGITYQPTHFLRKRRTGLEEFKKLISENPIT